MSLRPSTGGEGKRLPRSRVARSTVRTGCHSPVAALLGVLRSLSVAFRSCPVHLAACLIASCVCRGQRWERRARERAISGLPPPHTHSPGSPAAARRPLTLSPLSRSPTWQWFRDGAPLPDGRGTYSVSSKERTLTLRGAGPDDNGLYYCCARSAVGSVCSQDNFTLNIIGEWCPHGPAEGLCFGFPEAQR